MGSNTLRSVRLAVHTGLSTLLTLAVAAVVGLSSCVVPATAQDAAAKAKGGPPQAPLKVKLGLAVNRTAALKGYTLLATMNSKSIYLVDNEARVVHTWKPETTSAHCCYLLPNGHLLRPCDLAGRE